MPTRYLPRPDAAFSAFANHYYQAVKSWWSIQGLSESDLESLQTALAAWEAAFPAHISAQNAAEAARQAKDAAREALEGRIRPIANFIQTYPATTDADRAAIGITIRAPGSGSAPAPTSRPLVIVEPAGRFTHELRLVDEATPTRRARPRGVDRAEIYVAFTPAAAPAPRDVNAFRYVQSVHDGKAVLSYDPPQGGLQAHYLARWVTRRGAIGPWSDGASETVAA